MQSKSDADFLNTFSDETLEEAFPPTAQEAAELEAVEVFVVSRLGEFYFSSLPGSL